MPRAASQPRSRSSASQPSPHLEPKGVQDNELQISNTICFSHKTSFITLQASPLASTKWAFWIQRLGYTSFFSAKLKAEFLDRSGQLPFRFCYVWLCCLPCEDIEWQCGSIPSSLWDAPWACETTFAVHHALIDPEQLGNHENSWNSRNIRLENLLCAFVLFENCKLVASFLKDTWQNLLKNVFPTAWCLPASFHDKSFGREATSTFEMWICWSTSTGKCCFGVRALSGCIDWDLFQYQSVVRMVFCRLVLFRMWRGRRFDPQSSRLLRHTSLVLKSDFRGTPERSDLCDVCFASLEKNKRCLL